MAPELDAINAPVTVVVFEGAHRAVPIFPALQPESELGSQPVFEGVVCVITPTGEAMYYYDVDTAGMQLDGLSIDRIDQ